QPYHQPGKIRPQAHGARRAAQCAQDIWISRALKRAGWLSRALTLSAAAKAVRFPANPAPRKRRHEGETSMRTRLMLAASALLFPAIAVQAADNPPVINVPAYPPVPGVSPETSPPGTPRAPDWAYPDSPTHHQVPPPPGFHRATRTEMTPIGIFEGQSDV